MRAAYVSVLFALSLASRVRAQALPAPLDTAEIRTSATAHRIVKPTQVTIVFTVVAEDSTPAKVEKLLTARTDTVRRMLRSVGVLPDSILFASRGQWWGGRLEVVTHQRNVPASDPRFGFVSVVDSTYKARDVVEVRMTDFTKIGSVVEGAAALKVLDLSDVRYTSTDTRLAEDEALQDATARAQRQAQLMAKASGGTLGRVITLSTAPEGIGRVSDFTQVAPVSPINPNRTAAVTPPTFDISVTVFGRWQLLQRP